MHADRESVPPKLPPPLITARRAHPEAYTIEKSNPLRKFLARKRDRGELNLEQAAQLRRLDKLDQRPQVTFGADRIISINPSTESPSDSRLRPSSPPPAFTARRSDDSDSSALHSSAFELSDWSEEEGGSSASIFHWDSDLPPLVDRSEDSDSSIDLPSGRTVAPHIDDSEVRSAVRAAGLSGSPQPPRRPSSPHAPPASTSPLRDSGPPSPVTPPPAAPLPKNTPPPLGKRKARPLQHDSVTREQSQDAPKLGAIFCCRADARDLPAKVPLFDMRSPSIWSNPFTNGSNSETSACDAFEAWWQRQTVTVDTICSQFEVVRDRKWSGSEIAASPQRLAGVDAFARAVKARHRLAFGCDRQPGQRSHTWTYKRIVTDKAMQLLPSQPSVEQAEVEEEEYLIIFSGDSSLADRLAAQLKAKRPSCKVREIDIVNDAEKQNVLDPSLQAEITAGLYARRYKAVFLAIPCSSYSIVSGRKLRSKREPRGLSSVPKCWRAYLRKHNAMTDFGIQVAEICSQLSIPWAIENPADRAAPGPAFWQKFADWGTLWDQPRIQRLMQAGAKRHLIPLCMLGSPFQKYLHLLVSPELEDLAQEFFDGLHCTHSHHADLAIGRDERGRSKASTTATYPTAFNVLLARLLLQLRSGEQREAAARPAKVPSTSPGQLHVGSSRPHAIDGAEQEFQRQHRPSKAGSLRWLEPELESVLIDEPLPATNQPRRTKPDPPPPCPLPVPGPFTSVELFPEGLVEKVCNYRQLVQQAYQRAERGENGWRIAKELRPQALVFEEHEALNPCGFGFAWERADPHLPLSPQSLWRAIVPSSWPEDPPEPDALHAVDPVKFKELADKEGFTDEQLTSWMCHGFPGAGLPNVAVLNASHVGALKEMKAFAERNQRDVDNGFCTPCTDFPTIWPLITDPCNVVVQNGKPRLTIDKTMWTSGKAHLPPYNVLIDLAEQAARSGRLVLPTIAQFARAAAIFSSALVIFRSPSQPATVRLKELKFDIFAFFRLHRKQRTARRESGRIMREGFNIDGRCNFGETDAPDHTCRGTDACCFMCRRELARLDQEYPTQVPELKAFLDHRKLGRQRAGDKAVDEFLWDVLFFIMFYVDDAGVLVFDDPLYNRTGQPVMVLITDESGVQRTVHQTRDMLYDQAARGVAAYLGYENPEDKHEGPRFGMVLLGIHVDLDVQRRILPRQKALDYGKLVQRCAKGRRTMPNGLAAMDVSTFNSLIHRLLHASDVIPLGRQHLFYCRRDLKAVREVAVTKGMTMHSVIISKAAQGELAWWAHQLAMPDLNGLPLASRSTFPGSSSSSHLIRYSDAARELPPSDKVSGAGAWWVIRDVFYYVQFIWEVEELEAYSINVLEAHARDVGGMVALDKATELGLSITHTTAYVDNTTAEAVAENGRTSTEMLNLLNKLRLERLKARGIFESNERVASVDNDVADLISRGRIDEALRFPRDCGLECVECSILDEYRRLPQLAEA